jgi:hypothetical protein
MKNCTYSVWSNLICCFLILLLAHSNELICQFSDVTDDYGLAIFHDISVSESGVSFHDFDRDGLDDLTFASSGFGVFTFRNTGDGFEQVYYFPFIDGKTLHPIWVDYDNDGDADFFATRAWQCPVLFQNQGNQSFLDVSDMLPCPADGIVSTCATWGDYDSDNFLDVYVSNYNPLEDYGSPNWLFHNNGDGSFTEVGEEMGVAYGNFPAYQSMFIDTDFDRDQDLLVVNDKYDGCKFFRNDGGYFSEMGQENGFDVHIEAMSLSVSDFDHDGDYDYYISNTIEGNVFLVNQNGIFTDMSSELGTLVNANCWGTVFIDREMKTWEDIYVVSTGPTEGVNVMLKNAQGNDFNPQYEAFNLEDTEYSYAIAKGDANNDGAYDIMSMPYYANGSLLFQSSGPSSTFVKIIPQGTVSNRDGIGSTIRLFASGIQQIRPVTCGENFTSQDSRSIIFGTNSSSVDSIIIEWPSGWTDTWYNLELNNTFVLTEGDTYTTQDTLFYSLCNNESIILDAGMGSSFLWNDGVENAIRIVNQIGEYNVAVSNEFGFVRSVHFIVSSIVQTPSIQVTNETCNHSDGSVIITLPINASIDWLHGSSEGELYNLTEGFYAFTITDQYNCYYSDSVFVENVIPIVYEVTTDTACYGEMAYYNISINNTTSSPLLEGLSDWSGELMAGNYPFTLQDESGCVVYDDLNLIEYDELSSTSNYDIICTEENMHEFIIQSSIVGGSPPYLSNFSIPFHSHSSGIFSIIWTDANGCIDSSTIEIIEIPEIEIQLNFFLDDGVLLANANVTGGLPPYTYVWNDVSGGNIQPINNTENIEVTAIDLVGCSVMIDTTLIISNLSNYPKTSSTLCTTQVFDILGRWYYTLNSDYTLSHLKTFLPSGLWLFRHCGISRTILID